MLQGQASEAFDVLTTVDTTSLPPNLQYKKRELLGRIRYTQWNQAMEEASAPPQRGASQSLVSGNGEKWNPYSISGQLWRKAGRAARELCQEAETHFMAALNVEPRATDPAMRLVELQFAQGKPAGAKSLAAAHATRAPLDVDAHAFLAALSLENNSTSTASARSSRNVVDKIKEAAQRLCVVLARDPYSLFAAAGI